MSRLIDRVIHIFPSWNENQTEPHKMEYLGIGWYEPDPKVLDKPTEICICEASVLAAVATPS